MAGRTNPKAISLNDVRVSIEPEGGAVETIGMIQSVDVELTVEKSTIYEAGKKGVPVDVVFLKKAVTGSFERILVDVDILRALWPSFEEDPVFFDLKGTAVDEFGEDRNFTVTGCTIDGIPLGHKLEEETKQTIAYTGLGFYWG
jgi:hypothetical protein